MIHLRKLKKNILSKMLIKLIIYFNKFYKLKIALK